MKKPIPAFLLRISLMRNGAKGGHLGHHRAMIGWKRLALSLGRNLAGNGQTGLLLKELCRKITGHFVGQTILNISETKFVMLLKMRACWIWQPLPKRGFLAQVLRYFWIILWPINCQIRWAGSLYAMPWLNVGVCILNLPFSAKVQIVFILCLLGLGNGSIMTGLKNICQMTDQSVLMI